MQHSTPDKVRSTEHTMRMGVGFRALSEPPIWSRWVGCDAMMELTTCKGLFFDVWSCLKQLAAPTTKSRLRLRHGYLAENFVFEIGLINFCGN